MCFRAREVYLTVDIPHSRMSLSTISECVTKYDICNSHVEDKGQVGTWGREGRGGEEGGGGKTGDDRGGGR